MIQTERKTNYKEIVDAVCTYLNMNAPNLSGSGVEEMVKELCVARLCDSIGIKCKYNYKSDFFEFFSKIAGQAVCDNLEINIKVASDELRLIRYDHLNLVDRVKDLFKVEEVDQAIVDAFNLADKYKYLIPFLQGC